MRVALAVRARWRRWSCEEGGGREPSCHVATAKEDTPRPAPHTTSTLFGVCAPLLIARQGKYPIQLRERWGVSSTGNAHTLVSLSDDLGAVRVCSPRKRQRFRAVLLAEWLLHFCEHGSQDHGKRTSCRHQENEVSSETPCHAVVLSAALASPRRQSSRSVALPSIRASSGIWSFRGP